MKKITYLLAFVLLGQLTMAQNLNTLFEMMDNHDVNIYNVQKYAHDYFEKHGTDRGTGHNQYKRWEYEMQYWMDEQGNRVNPREVFDAVNNFRNENDGIRTLGTSPWQDLGPDYWNRTSSWNPGVGRIDAIAVNPFNRDEIYIGSPEGGVWKTTDGGFTWNSITDGLTYMKIGHVAIDPVTPSTIYIGTAGAGMLKSTNGGITLTQINSGLSATQNVKKILIDPTNTNRIFLATTNGIYRSLDGGNNWTRPYAVSTTDLEFKPDDPNIVYACGNSFYKSVDGGATFATVSNGIVKSDVMRIAVTPANPNLVCIAQCNGSVFGYFYRSTDAGSSFTVTVTGSSANGTNFFGYSPNGTDNSGQGGYNIGICISPVNANLIHIGGIITWRSTDGGYNWSATTEWRYPSSREYTHCDMHVLEYFGNTLYTGSDGGISFSDNDADNFNDLSTGLGIRMIYRLALSETDPVRIAFGSQDNGSSVRNSTGWLDWLGADGMESAIDPTDANVMYGTSQYGSLYRSLNGGNSYSSLSRPDTGNWITPLIIDPNAPSTLYAGYKQIFKSTNRGSSWTAISSFTGTTKFDHLAIARTNSQVIYASRGTTLYRTTDGGANWISINAGLSSLTINRIALHDDSPDKVAVATSSNRIYTSTDGGATWTNYSANFPAVTARCLIYDNSPNDGIYVGTNSGIYYRDKTMSGWVSYSDDLPMVPINELEIQYSIKKIRVATYGRGIWENDLYDISTGINKAVTENHTLQLFPNPSTGKFYFKTNNLKDGMYNLTCKSVTGQEVYAGKLYIGKNKVTELNLSGLATGIYYLNISNGESQAYSKVVIQ